MSWAGSLRLPGHDVRPPGIRVLPGHTLWPLTLVIPSQLREGDLVAVHP